MNYTEINNEKSLRLYVERLKSDGRTTIALDLEGEFNLHVYGERLCLVQVYDGREAVIIDPLKMDPAALKPFFEDEKLLKVMWDASSDISLMVNGYDMTIKSILDLRPAADVLQLPKKDYASVLQELLGIETRKKKKFQRYNWLRRPIDPEAIEYAVGDVLHIPELKRVLLERLSEVGGLEEFLHQNLIVQNRDYKRRPGERHKKMKSYRHLRRNEKELLKRLFDLRDTHARRLNLPPHNVIENPDLLSLSRGNLQPEKLRFARRISEGDRKIIVDELCGIMK